MKNKHLTFWLVSIVNLVLAGSLQTANAQSGKMPVKKETSNPGQVKINANSGCFDCDYFPMCKYDVTKEFDGKQYRGLKSNIWPYSYYNCEKGVLTRKWYTSYTPTGTEVDVDIFEKTITTIHTTGATEYTLHTLVMLKPNVSTGSKWDSQHGGEVAVIHSDTSVTYHGVKYDHAMITYDGYYYMFLAKGVGLFQVLKKPEYEQMLNDAIIAKGSIDTALIGHWYQYKGINEFYFGPDGSGAASIPRSINMKWSVMNSILFMSSEIGILDMRLAKFPAYIKLDGITYMHKQWVDPATDVTANKKLIASQRFRVVMDRNTSEKNELIIRGDSLDLLLPASMGGPVAFTSTKFSYSIERMTGFGGGEYGSKITVTVKNKKDEFNFQIGTYDINRDVQSSLMIGGTKKRYQGTMTDLEGN